MVLSTSIIVVYKADAVTLDAVLSRLSQGSVSRSAHPDVQWGPQGAVAKYRNQAALLEERVSEVLFTFQCCLCPVESPVLL
jgi:hypothetical protein